VVRRLRQGSERERGVHLEVRVGRVTGSMGQGTIPWKKSKQLPHQRLEIVSTLGDPQSPLSLMFPAMARLAHAWQESCT